LDFVRDLSRWLLHCEHWQFLGDVWIRVFPHRLFGLHDPVFPKARLMLALGLGLIAAFCWGVHDVCVRRVSQDTPLMASLLTVLVAGTMFQSGIMAATGSFEMIPRPAQGYAVLSGVCFLVASLGLYGAFQRGPVRLVAPIIAGFPILSVAWAAARGVPVGMSEWFAVLAVLTGVSVVAILSDDATQEIPRKGRTILYAFIAAIGFGSTFSIGQIATEIAPELPVVFITRVTSIILLLGLMIARSLPFWPGRAALPVLIIMGCLDGIALICVMSAGGLPNAHYAAVATSVFGLLTIVMAWLFLKERMTALQWGGVALSFAGIAFLAS
jgi:drug/metabolite transporter (DMT)-like permease